MQKALMNSLKSAKISVHLRPPIGFLLLPI